MFTITNATILKGSELSLKKENIVVDDGKIIEINKFIWRIIKNKLFLSSLSSTVSNSSLQ